MVIGIWTMAGKDMCVARTGAETGAQRGAKRPRTLVIVFLSLVFPYMSSCSLSQAPDSLLASSAFANE